MSKRGRSSSLGGLTSQRRTRAQATAAKATAKQAAEANAPATPRQEPATATPPAASTAPPATGAGDDRNHREHEGSAQRADPDGDDERPSQSGGANQSVGSSASRTTPTVATSVFQSPAPRPASQVEQFFTPRRQPPTVEDVREETEDEDSLDHPVKTEEVDDQEGMEDSIPVDRQPSAGPSRPRPPGVDPQQVEAIHLAFAADITEVDESMQRLMNMPAMPNGAPSVSRRQPLL